MATDKLVLAGMIFFGYHGTLAPEHALGQRFVVDVDLHCDLRAAGQSDDLAQTVDYSQVHDQVRAILEGRPRQLTEAVAEAIAAAILDQHALVEAVRVKVTKPNVRLGTTVLSGAAVEIFRQRT